VPNSQVFSGKVLGTESKTNLIFSLTRHKHRLDTAGIVDGNAKRCIDSIRHLSPEFEVRLTSFHPVPKRQKKSHSTVGRQPGKQEPLRLMQRQHPRALARVGFWVERKNWKAGRDMSLIDARNCEHRRTNN